MIFLSFIKILLRNCIFVIVFCFCYGAIRELPRDILAETAYTIQSYTIYRLYTRPSNLAAHRSLCSYNLKNYPDALNSTSLQPQTVCVNNILYKEPADKIVIPYCYHRHFTIKFK